MSELTLVIGNKNYSSWSLRPWFLLSHYRVPFEENKIALFRSDMAEKLSPVSPTMKVPVLHHDDTVIWDSLAICEYVNEVFLKGIAWPKAADARGVARAACAELHSGFPELRKRWPMNCRLQEKLNVDNQLGLEIKRIDELWQECLSCFGGSNGYLFDQFSIADCFYAPIVLRFHSYQPELSEVSKAYMAKVLSNPALLEWIKSGQAETDIIKEDEVDYLRALNPENY